MIRVPLTQQKEHHQLDAFTEIVHKGRHFRKNLNINLLKEVLRQGELLMLNAEEPLISRGDVSPPEMYILIEGSLVVMAEKKLILRLDMPGDVAGEMSVVSTAPRSADVIAETDCKLIAFSDKIFRVTPDSLQVSAFYVMFAHVMASKLKMTTAQSLLRKNERTHSNEAPLVAIIDVDANDRTGIRGALETGWKRARIVEFSDPQEFIDAPSEQMFDLIIMDVLYSHSYKTQIESLKTLLETAKTYGAPIFVISKHCAEPLNRANLVQQGADELLIKPFSNFDLRHALKRFKIWYYKQCELDRIEHAADTDRLTSLSNRRRLDEFIGALVTLYPDNKNPFSLIIADVDYFKHYNDSNGHQMGDFVLAGVAAVFSRCIRRGDLPARFGGEEFVVVLPNSNKQAAIAVGENLRQAIENEVFPHQENQPLGNLTATFGVATFPDDAESAEELFKKADDCLYRGKEAGRNVVVPAGC